MTYHPIVRWRCIRCGNGGEVVCDPRDAVDVRWERVLAAHLDADEACATEHGHSGIAVQEERSQLPA